MRRIEQIEESAATGDIAVFYDAFRTTLPSSFVPTVYRLLARYPAYLQPAWSNLGPALGTVSADRAAQALRTTMAVRIQEILAAHNRRLSGVSPAARNEIRGVLQTFAHVLPKSWLGILALGEAWSGRSIDGLSGGRPEDRLPTERGVPPSMPTIPVLDLDSPDPRVQKIFTATQTRLGRLAVPNIYRTLARWPDYLEAVWEQVIDPEILREIRATLPDLTSRAVGLVGTLPGVLRTDRAAAELTLTSEDCDDIETILNTYRKTMPETAMQILGLLDGLER